MTSPVFEAFRVDLDGPIAAYRQIENQVQFAIASGRIQAGDMLPSVREMSTALDLNPNTVTKAYRDLELMGLVHMRRGVGVTVTANAVEVCREKMLVMVKKHLTDAVAECVASGLVSAEIHDVVNGVIASGTPPYSEDANDE